MQFSGFWANFELRAPPPWGQNSAGPLDQNPGSTAENYKLMQTRQEQILAHFKSIFPFGFRMEWDSRRMATQIMWT